MKIFDVNEKVLSENYSDMLEQMKSEAVKFYTNFKDDPKNLSEWGHNYFCTEDGERLIFNLDKPKHHECKLCHTVYSTKTLDNVWTYFYRNEAILTLTKLAVLYRMEKKQEYLDEYKKILGFYSDNYTKFDIHVKDQIVDDLTLDVGGAGRLMPQGLNEAIVIIRVIMSLELLKGHIDDEFVNSVIKNMLVPATEILRPQVIRIHNIPCWLNSALGAIALFTGDSELEDFVMNSEFGINNQLLEGVTADKFWYEGSIHYNFFLLEGVTYFLSFCKLYGKTLKNMNIIEDMLVQAYNYAFDNDVLPNPNDGWPNLNLKSYEYIYCLASKVFGEDSKVCDIYKHIVADSSPRGDFPLSKPYYFNNDISFERLVCQPDVDVNNRKEIERTSVSFPNSYFAMLKNENVNLFLKYGHRGSSHAHPDKMNIELVFGGKSLSRDLSNTGYASKLCNEWHRQSVSHNTVVVDGENHVSVEGGTCLEFKEDICHVKVKDVYEGADYERRVQISDKGFTDEFKVSSSQEHVYDFLFHSEAELLTEISENKADLGFSTNGYEHIKEINKLTSESDTIVLKWKLADMIIESEMDVNGKEIFIAKTYDNPVSSYRTAIILREKSSKATFNMTWEIK